MILYSIKDKLAIIICFFNLTSIDNCASMMSISEKLMNIIKKKGSYLYEKIYNQ